MVAADTCLSRCWNVAGQERPMFRDDVQKIYTLTPEIVLAITTDNMRAARDLLHRAQPVAAEIASELLGTGRCFPAMSRLYRALSYLWTKFGGPTTGLVVSVANGNNARLFTWSSRSPRSPMRELECGEHVVLGSLRASSELGLQLARDLSVVAHLQMRRQPLDPDASSLQLFDKVTMVFAHEAARSAGIGGLVQMAYHDGTCFVMPAMDSVLCVQGQGVAYAIGIEYDGDRWVQVDRKSGRRVPVMRLDDHHLGVHSDNRFSY